MFHRCIYSLSLHRHQECCLQNNQINNFHPPWPDQDWGGRGQLSGGSTDWPHWTRQHAGTYLDCGSFQARWRRWTRHGIFRGSGDLNINNRQWTAGTEQGAGGRRQCVGVIYSTASHFYPMTSAYGNWPAAQVEPGLYAGPNYCQSHVLVDTWMLTVKPVYKL